MTTKKLIDQDIIDAMLALGYTISENDNGVLFMPPIANTHYVLYGFQKIEVYHFNEDSDREQYQRTIQVNLNTLPSLSEWLLLMHVGQAISLHKAMQIIEEKSTKVIFHPETLGEVFKVKERERRIAN